MTRSRLVKVALVAFLAGLLVSAALIFANRVATWLEPASLRTRVEALSFEPPAGWVVENGGESVIRSAFADGDLNGSDAALDLLNVNERTQALALLIEDGEAKHALRADLLPADGQGDPVGIREAALLSIDLIEDLEIDRFERSDGDLPYAGYRAGSGLSRRSVVFVSFVPGIVRLTILAPDAIADLLIASLAYDPPPAPDASPSDPVDEGS
jgi:hypothetical protein